MVLSKETDSKVETDEDITSAIVKYSEKKLKVLNKRDVLAFTDSEQQADSFAVRFGYGADLVTGLEKFDKKQKQFIGTINILMTMYRIYIVIIWILFLGVQAGLMIGLLMIINMLIVRFVIGLFGSTDARRTTYDSLKDRYRRIRNDMINMIRSPEFPKEAVEAMIENIDKVTKMVDNTGSGITFFESIGDRLPWNYGDMKYTRLQKLFENLNFNELHVMQKRLELHLERI
jgi:hypothetical protein